LSLGLAVTGAPGLFLALIFVLGIGVSQVLWMVPSIVYFRRHDRPELAKGLIIGAALTFLLNGACWAIFFPDVLRTLVGGRLF
jgi:hypothetical protein